MVNISIESLEAILNRDAIATGAINEGEYMKVTDYTYDEEKKEFEVIFDLYKETVN